MTEDERQHVTSRLADTFEVDEGEIERRDEPDNAPDIDVAWFIPADLYYPEASKVIVWYADGTWGEMTRGESEVRGTYPPSSNGPTEPVYESLDAAIGSALDAHRLAEPDGVKVTRISHADAEHNDGEPAVFYVDEWGPVCSDCIVQHGDAGEDDYDRRYPPRLVELGKLHSGVVNCGRCRTTLEGSRPQVKRKAEAYPGELQPEHSESGDLEGLVETLPLGTGLVGGIPRRPNDTTDRPMAVEFD
jgi:hypothetical protein